MKMPDTQTPRATVELSNYPPKLTKNDILRLFAEFQIADFDVPTARSFSVPLRVSIEVAGKGEAQRAVKELSGRVIEGRRVCVKITENTGYEAREVVVEEMANELKLGIINTARIFNPEQSSRILVVRELMTATTYHAYLQARDPITVTDSPEVQYDAQENIAHWKFLGAGTASANDPEGRLKALEDLQALIEQQGKALGLWMDWEGSELMNYD